MSRARRRSIYCTPAEWAEISGLADEADMSNSAFLIACALADDDGERPDTVLALTGEEQRTQYRRIESLDRWSEALFGTMPGTGVSMLDAVAFLHRLAEERGQ